jgi:hypothetical protein
MAVAFDHPRSEPPLDEVPDAVIFLVEAARHAVVQPLHSR